MSRQPVEYPLQGRGQLKFLSRVARLLEPVMYTARSLLVVAIALTVSAAPAAAAPAVWIQHDLIVHLNHLPKSYKCDELWYKFRDVLRAIGARPDPSIAVYQCGPGLGLMAFSPQVHLRFFLPETLQDGNAHVPEINATPQTVRLEPGHPASIDSADCELLRQMKNGLLTALPRRVVSFKLACDAPPTRFPFNLSVQTLAPSERPARVAARD